MAERVDIQTHKIMTLEPDKRDRIINAAMREFCEGYEKASTDRIVREAGISKGLLFYYFGTKEQLYTFLIWYSFDMVKEEYYGLVNTTQHDLLDCLWQMMLLKLDLMQRYPSVFTLLTKAYLSEMSDLGQTFATPLRELQQSMMTEVYANLDVTLLKEGLDPKKVTDIIMWTLNGYAEMQIHEDMRIDDYHQEYDRYLSDIQAYFAIFRQGFYKEKP